MVVRHEIAIPRSLSRYSISVPGRISIGPGVTTRKPSHGGVIASRLSASPKNGKTFSGGAGSVCSRVRTWTAIHVLYGSAAAHAHRLRLDAEDDPLVLVVGGV